MGMLVKCAAISPSGIRIVLDVWVVGVLLRSLVVWGVNDSPGVEVAYIDADAGSCVEVLSKMWGEIVV